MMTGTPPDGELFDFQADLRRGGWVGVTSSALVVSTDEEYRIDAAAIQEVTVEDLDYFVGLLGLVLVGYGLYSVRADALFGLGFTAIGLGSLYLTYRKRNRVRIRVTGRPKPLTVYPTSTAALTDALEPLLAAGETASEQN